MRPAASLYLDALAALDPAHDAFLPPELVGRGRSLASYLMYVDYAESGCGPYRELLFKRLREGGLELDLDDERVVHDL